MNRNRATPISTAAVRIPPDRPSRIAIVVGTRPEVIKMAPVVRSLSARSALSPFVISTGQQRELVAQALGEANVTADVTLDLMTANQTPSGFAGALSRRDFTTARAREFRCSAGAGRYDHRCSSKHGRSVVAYAHWSR